MRKLLLFIILFLLICYGGLEFYIRYKVNQGMEQLIAVAAPFMLIQYDGVTWTRKGTVGVTGLRLAFHDNPDQIGIDEVLVHAPDLWFLFKGRQKVEQGELPKQLGMSLNGLVFNTDSEFMYQAKQLAQSAVLPLLSKDLCGDITYIGPDEWRAMGYETLTINIHTSYKLNSNSKGIELTTQYIVQDMFDVDTKLSMIGSTPITLNYTTENKLKFSKFILNYSDDSLVEKTNTFCAKEQSKKSGKKLNADQYILAKVKILDSTLQNMGYHLSDDLLDAYRNFLTKPDTLQLKAIPNRSQDLSTLHLYKPDDITQLLNISLTVNEVPVTDLSIIGGTTQVPLSSPIDNKQKTKIEVHWEDRYRTIDIAEVGKYRSKTLRIYTSRGKVHQGKLINVRAEGILSMKKRAYGGNLVFDVPPQDVTRIEVLERVKVEKVVVIHAPPKPESQ